MRQRFKIAPKSHHIFVRSVPAREFRARALAPSRPRRDGDFGMTSSMSFLHAAFSSAGRNRWARRAIARCKRSRNALSVSIWLSSCQRFGIADRKIARIVASKQANRAFDARSQHWNAGGGGFGYDVRSTFVQRRQNHGARTAEQTPHIRARPVAAPDVAWIGRHLGPRRCRPLRRLGGPKMHDANPRGCRQTTRGLGGAKRILDLAQMADHGDVEATRPPVMHT